MAPLLPDPHPSLSPDIYNVPPPPPPLPLSPEQLKRIQQKVGTLLYYSRAVDLTLAAALSTIASQQSSGTQAMLDACHQLLDYVATHLNATIRYCASDMILALDTDSSYLSEPNAK